MKYTKKERLEIGRRIYEGEINRAEAALEYDIDMYTARDYMRLYKASQRLAAQAEEAPADSAPAPSPARRELAKHTPAQAVPASKHSAGEAPEALSGKPYERMTKTELIRELRRLTQNPDKKDS